MAAVIERQSVKVRPTGAALAADIDGVDLSEPLDPETLAAIKRAWGEHLVLRFRGQTLSDDDLMRFSRHFGELDWAPIAAARVKVRARIDTSRPRRKAGNTSWWSRT